MDAKQFAQLERYLISINEKLELLCQNRSQPTQTSLVPNAVFEPTPPYLLLAANGAGVPNTEEDVLYIGAWRFVDGQKKPIESQVVLKSDGLTAELVALRSALWTVNMAAPKRLTIYYFSRSVYPFPSDELELTDLIKKHSYEPHRGLLEEIDAALMDIKWEASCQEADDYAFPHLQHLYRTACAALQLDPFL